MSSSKRPKVRVHLRINANLMERLEDCLDTLELPPTKTSVFEAALSKYLDYLETVDEDEDEDEEDEP